MKRHTSRNSRGGAKRKPSRNEDSDVGLRARTEEEKRRRRREWMIEQEKMDRHNRLKRKMAMEYEIRRARDMGLEEGRCNRPLRSRSESPPRRCRRTSMYDTPEDTVLSKKFETSSDTKPLFKGSEGTKINPIELRKIKVDIHRNIPGRVATNELKRDIPNKEDVMIKRRAELRRFWSPVIFKNFLNFIQQINNVFLIRPGYSKSGIQRWITVLIA